MHSRSNKFCRRLLLAVGLALVSSTSAFAQSSATTSAGASAVIVKPIQLAKITDLYFGKLVAGVSGGTATVDAADAITVGGGVTQPGTQGGTPTSASFNVTGEAAFTYDITLPASATITSGTPADDLTVDTFTKSIVSGTLSGALGDVAAGTQSFKVGAKLTVPATHPAATYSGTFSVTVAYN